MKCPKCGYISFDYNTKCPKCNKDIATEQEKLNFPPFKPNPPFLLESLIGEATDSAPALHVRQSKKVGPDIEAGGMDEPVFAEKNASGEIQEINIASYGPNESQNRELGSLELPVDSAGTDEFNQSGDELSLDLGDQTGSPGISAGADQISLNLDQASDELTGAGDTGDLDFDLDENAGLKSAKDTDLKLDDFSLDEEPKAGAKKLKAANKLNLDEISSDIDLDDEDLSIDLENLDLDLDLDASDSEK